MKKYNVGVIGYGWVATAHIPAINGTTLGQVTAVCSSRKLNGSELSAKHGGTITAYKDVEDMLANPDIHAVSICSYPYDHAKQVIAAARAGKHLIIEKPLCLSLQELPSLLRWALHCHCVQEGASRHHEERLLKVVQVLEAQQAWLLRQVRLQPVWGFRSVAVRLHFCGIAQ